MLPHERADVLDEPVAHVEAPADVGAHLAAGLVVVPEDDPALLVDHAHDRLADVVQQHGPGDGDERLGAGQARLRRRRQEPASAQLRDHADDVRERLERVLEDVEVVVGVLLDAAQAVDLGEDHRQRAPHGEVAERDRRRRACRGGRRARRGCARRSRARGRARRGRRPPWPPRRARGRTRGRGAPDAARAADRRRARPASTAAGGRRRGRRGRSAGRRCRRRRAAGPARPR